MSRIGKQLITIPEKTEVKISGTTFSVKGPLGELSRVFKPSILVKVVDGKVVLEPQRNDNETKALWGTYASHISNMITGVNTAFQKKLIIEGIGFKSDVKGEDLTMSLGYSHAVKLKIPKTLKVSAEKNIVTISGSNKEDVGQFAAQIRSQKQPEPYKGKGIRYEDEVIRRKQGKKTA
jgi:large subunit ribosomal protein L6